MGATDSVTNKTLAMPKKVTHKRSVNNSKDDALWWKVRVRFNTKHQVDDSALYVAVRLRKTFPALYFARYNPEADVHYIDFIVKCKQATGVKSYAGTLVKAIEVILAAKPLVGSYQVMAPEMHSGSDAHAAAFETIYYLARHFALSGARSEEDEGPHGDIALLGHALADLQHWMANMLGFDYIEELQHKLKTAIKLVECMTPPKTGSTFRSKT